MHALDEFWHRKYVEDKEGRLVRVPAGASDHPADGHEEGHAIHLPSPSFWPLVAAVGLPVIAYGVLYSWWLVGAGALVTVVGFMGWAMEPRWRSSDGRHHRARGAGRTHEHRASEHEARDVALPGVGVPAVRRVDHDLRPVPGRQHDRARIRATIFDIRYTSVSSFVLLAQLAHDGAGTHGGAISATTRGCACGSSRTAMLGLTFVGGQVYEFTSFYHEGLTLTTQPVRDDLLRAHRVPRRPRDGRDPDAALARRDVVGRPAARRVRRSRGDGRAVLALRRHRVDRHLHGQSIWSPKRNRPGARG